MDPRRMRATRTAALVAVAALAVPLVPAHSAHPVVSANTSRQSATQEANPVVWGKCPREARASGVQCGTLDVPLDYSDPAGPTIEIALSRLRSKNAEKRRGVLLTNTGGPGGPGLSYPALLRDALGMPEKVLDRYDVIGVDPRGVGRSTPVTCDLSLLNQPSNIPIYAVDNKSVRKEAKRVKRVAQKCARSDTAGLLPHINTTNTARDLDQVRAALGEETVSYFGVSYGTKLGAVYATLFPERTDRVLLDSSTSPDDWPEFFRLLGRGVEDRFPDFAKYVAARPGLGLGRTPRQVRATYLELAARLDRLPSKQGYNGQAFRFVTFAALYYDSEFPGLAETWRSLDRGEPVKATSAPTERAAAGIPEDNYIASQLYVFCNDADFPETVGSYVKNVARDRMRYPLFGAAAANITPCAFWPSEPVEPPVEIGDDGPSNILILQNRRDPATPLAGAREMKRALGDRARLVTVDQGGHLAYLVPGNTCADRVATRFLVSGQRPSDGRACPQADARLPSGAALKSP